MSAPYFKLGLELNLKVIQIQQNITQPWQADAILRIGLLFNKYSIK
jgi:hypothetical protein